MGGGGGRPRAAEEAWVQQEGGTAGRIEAGWAWAGGAGLGVRGDGAGGGGRVGRGRRWPQAGRAPAAAATWPILELSGNEEKIQVPYIYTQQFVGAGGGFTRPYKSFLGAGGAKACH